MIIYFLYPTNDKTTELSRHISLVRYIINNIINQIKVLDYREHLKDPLNQGEPKVSLRFHFLPYISDKFPLLYTVYFS